MKMGVFWPALLRKLALLHCGREDQLLISSTVNLCLPDVTHVFGALEIAKGAGAAWMNHA